ncbi:sugar phosphate isomerase/epimerase family protein [Pararhodospirillum oryzae]|uniref:Xylose isomerase n=1 Tax=Pararhodospirillum oryzae TaxID=478448 RepID=A0A512H6G3_9PROT|nr:sugar phosphate isomerase/epimerase family protein [Pararhodospirillum oryzae]GEO81056.1 xylose isomerase [Pararhodospirillum oryzae]
MSRVAPSPFIGFTVAQGTLQGLDRQAGRAADLGADGVELALTALGVVIGGRVRTQGVTGVARVLATHGLGATVHAPLSLSFMDTDNASRQQAVAEASVDVAGALGARVLVVHPGWVDAARFQAHRDELMAREREGLARLAERARAQGVTIALENMPVILEYLQGARTNHGLDPASVAAQVQAVDHPALRATIDVSHAHIAARYFGWDLAGRLAALAPVTTHLHLHDSLGAPLSMVGLFPGEDRVFGVGDLHMPLGWGDVPFDTVLPGLPLPAGFSFALEIGLERVDDDVAAGSLARARALGAAMIAARQAS